MKNSALNTTFYKGLAVLIAWLLVMIMLSACGDSQPTPATSPQPPSQVTPTPPITQTLPLTTQPPVRVETTVPATANSPLSPKINPTTLAAAVRTPLEEDNIREAILSHRFAEFPLTSAPPSQYYCLGLGNLRHSDSLQDLSPAFLARFQANKPPVRKASDCARSQDGTKVKATGEPATIWAIDSIFWVNDNEVKLDISYTAAIMDSGGDVLQLKKENGSWKVTGGFGSWRT